MITSFHIFGMVATLVLVLGISLLSGRKVKDAGDFDSAGKRAGPFLVSGALLGTLVGGSSTIGTAQLAYSYGMSAWWFTLGGGIACLVLAIGFVRPLRRENTATMTGILANEYGRKIGMAASVLSSVGTFINILSQLIAATAIISIVFPSVSSGIALMISAVLMILYVIFGGVFGAGMVGIVKIILLFAAVIAGTVIVLNEMGLPVIYGSLDHGRYFNLFARGVGTDAGAGLSLILGVLSTQSYAQALLSGRTDKDAKKGALLSACLIPVIGIGGVLIGQYMRVAVPNLESAKMAFPQFIMMHMHPVFAGVVFATLLIAVLGTGSGLALGISTVINNDVAKKFTRKLDEPKKSLLFSRVVIILLLALACILCICPIGDTILNFAFMSMGLRGTVIFIPLCCALWLKKKVSGRWVLISIIVSPVMVLVFGLTKWVPFDSLFIGMICSAVLCLIGYIANKKSKGTA